MLDSVDHLKSRLVEQFAIYEDSSISHADIYRSGINSIHDIVHQHTQQAQSLLDHLAVKTGQMDVGEEEKMINAIVENYVQIALHCVVGINYLDYNVPGQDSMRHDLFNHKLKFQPNLVKQEGPADPLLDHADKMIEAAKVEIQPTATAPARHKLTPNTKVAEDNDFTRATDNITQQIDSQIKSAPSPSKNQRRANR